MHAGYPDCEAALLVELDGPEAEVRSLGPVIDELCRAAGATEIRRRRDARAAGADVEGPQGGVRGDGPRLARLLRAGRRDPADEAARGAARHRASWRPSTACASATCSTPATATCTRWCCTTAPRRARPSARSRWPTRILELCVAARRLDHRRARRRPRQGVLDAEDVHRRRPDGDGPAALARSIPSGCRNPGKVLPTPRLCGEVPGLPPRASGRGGRPGRAVLMLRPTTEEEVRRRCWPRPTPRGRSLIRAAAARSSAGAGRRRASSCPSASSTG